MTNSPFKNYTTLGIDANDKLTGIQLFAAFNSYQKSRMDFLADVTFGKPTLETTKMFFSDIMAELDKNRILLENISGTNDFKYKFVIRNLTNCRNRKHELCESCKCCIINSKTQMQNDDNVSIPNDVAVSIPNDVLGCHAFYLILENIIRNCAKHGARKPDQKICIDLDNCENEEDFYQVSIYDDSTFKNESKLNELVRQQNDLLNKDILIGNRLRQGGWGLIEMEAATAYLRKHELEDINDKEYEIDINDEQHIYPKNRTAKNHKGKPNFLKAIGVYNKHYGYRLFLLKPKELLVIYDESGEETVRRLTAKSAVLRTNGVKLVKMHKTGRGESFNSGAIYSYPLMIFVGSKKNYEDSIKENETALPIRQLVCLTGARHKNTRFSFGLNKATFGEIFAQENVDEILNEIWKAWTLRQFKYLKINIDLSFLDSSYAKENTENLLDTSDACDVIKYFDARPAVSFNDHAIEACALICQGNDDDSYAEPYNSKDYPLLSKLIRNDDKHFPKTINESDIAQLCRLIEGTATTIHIIDERIQELAEESVYKPERDSRQMSNNLVDQIQFIDLLYCTHVIVPQSPESKSGRVQTPESERFNLNAKDFSSFNQKIVKYIKSTIKPAGSRLHSKRKADFLLIHLGVIEKLIRTYHEEKYGADDKRVKEAIDDKKVKEFIENEILGNDLDIDTKIIVISGRGKPHNLPEGYLYLNFSIVAQYCIENRLKYFLNDVVHSAKRI